MTAASFQLNLRLELPPTRPLLPMKAAMVLLDRSEDEVLAMIESGEIEWAWDIRSRDAEKREVRVWRGSLLSILHSPPSTDDGEERVLASLFPYAGPEIRSTHLQRMFTVSQGHIQNLINEGLLKGLNDPRTGPNGFVRVTRVSVIEFLKSRRIT